MLPGPLVHFQYIFMGLQMWMTLPEEINFERVYIKPMDCLTVFGVLSFDIYGGRITMTARRAILNCHLPHVPLCSGVRMNEALTWRLIEPTAPTIDLTEAAASELLASVVEDDVAAVNAQEEAGEEEGEEEEIEIDIPTFRNMRTRTLARRTLAPYWAAVLRPRVSH